ncbi:membrane protein [Sediminihabitans luteus]|uniref:Membrane protein n=1 Tax=Sediminihabitans luteus TaxID=1138585 RepID=A0A2M9CPF8_9CELL|nr:YhjD/YihY/BrkB family envelope integrity protein [Sediminihabitans luteus]PJJ73775.1 membrane protein [Sediminihabitans luteus]GIJ00544.1 hypothetical protein Slu03_29210 [Sediminihabitans luteus]
MTTTTSPGSAARQGTPGSTLLRRALRTWPGRVGMRTARQLQELEVFDRAMTLAAQAFTSIVPVLIAIGAILPRDSTAGAALADLLGLDDATRETLTRSLPSGASAQSAFGVVGVLVVLVSATSFSRALSRTYARAWDLPRPSGLGMAWRWLAVLLSICLVCWGVFGVRRALADGGLEYVEPVVVLAVHAVVWTWVPYLLFAGRRPVRSFVPGGVLMGVAVAVLSVAASIYLPRALASAAQQFGSLGIAFTYLSWLFVLSFALVLTTALGRVLHGDPGRLGRALRGPDPAPVGTWDTGADDHR